MIGEKKVIATYIRVATNDESVADIFRAEIKEYIAELEFVNDILITTESADIGCSGRSTNNPGLNELLEFVKLGNVDLVVTTSISQFSHNRTDAEKVIAGIEEYGAVVDFTNEPELLEEEDGLTTSD